MTLDKRVFGIPAITAEIFDLKTSMLRLTRAATENTTFDKTVNASTILTEVFHAG